MYKLYNAIYIVNRYNNIYHIECTVHFGHPDTVNKTNTKNTNEHREQHERSKAI
jgi:hypothetical protein